MDLLRPIILLNKILGVFKNTLLENNMFLVLLGLKFTFHLLAQSDILAKSLFKILAVSSGVLPLANI